MRVDRVAADVGLAPGRREERREDPDRRRLAGAVGADEAEQVALLEFQVERLQGEEVAVFLGEVDRLDHGCGSAARGITIRHRAWRRQAAASAVVAGSRAGRAATPSPVAARRPRRRARPGRATSSGDRSSRPSRPGLERRCRPSPPAAAWKPATSRIRPTSRGRRDPSGPPASRSFARGAAGEGTGERPRPAAGLGVVAVAGPQRTDVVEPAGMERARRLRARTAAGGRHRPPSVPCAGRGRASTTTTGDCGHGRPLGLEQPARRGRDRHAVELGERLAVGVVGGGERGMRRRRRRRRRSPRPASANHDDSRGAVAAKTRGRGDVERGRCPATGRPPSSSRGRGRVTASTSTMSATRAVTAPRLPTAPPSAHATPVNAAASARKREPGEPRAATVARHDPPVERIEAEHVDEPEGGDQLEWHRPRRNRPRPRETCRVRPATGQPGRAPPSPRQPPPLQPTRDRPPRRATSSVSQPCHEAERSSSMSIPSQVTVPRPTQRRRHQRQATRSFEGRQVDHARRRPGERRHAQTRLADAVAEARRPRVGLDGSEPAQRHESLERAGQPAGRDATPALPPVFCGRNARRRGRAGRRHAPTHRCAASTTAGSASTARAAEHDRVGRIVIAGRRPLGVDRRASRRGSTATTRVCERLSRSISRAARAAAGSVP